ncbi:hypothetical protein FQA39_LY09951 [Lamprigera yunnana]|nr:hypothetical protein FQA39_LY09951 [Lamprigera yunnana]
MVIELIKKIKVEVGKNEIDMVNRIGEPNKGRSRPIKVRTEIRMKEDRDKKTRDIRNKLTLYLIEVREQGNRAIIVDDALIVDGETWKSEELEKGEERGSDKASKNKQKEEDLPMKRQKQETKREPSYEQYPKETNIALRAYLHQ